MHPTTITSGGLGPQSMQRALVGCRLLLLFCGDVTAVTRPQDVPVVSGTWDVSSNTLASYVESQLASSPDRPEVILATAMNLGTGGSDVFVSGDAGRRWERVMPGDGTGAFTFSYGPEHRPSRAAVTWSDVSS